MANSLGIRDIDLNQTTLTGRRNPVVELDAFRAQYKVDKETRQRTDEPMIYLLMEMIFQAYLLQLLKIEAF